MREKIPKPEWAINKMKDENKNQSYAQLAEPSQKLGQVKQESRKTREGDTVTESGDTSVTVDDMVTESADMSVNVGDACVNDFEDIDD